MGLKRREQERLVPLMKEGDASDADRAERVAVVGLSEMHEPRLFLKPAAFQLPILKGHLQRDFHRGRAIVGIEDARQAAWRDVNELFGQLNRRHIGKAEKCGMGDPAELGPQSPIQCRVPMTVKVDPNRGDAIQETIPARVLHIDTLTALDD